MNPRNTLRSRFTARRYTTHAGWRAALAGILLGALLGGCGFQLRGSAPASPGEAAGSLFFEAPPALHADLESALAGSAVPRAASRETADAVLVVASERFERRVLSVDAYDGSEREAEIAYTVEFRIGRGGEGSAMDERRIVLVRDFLYTPEEVVAKEHEEDRIREELRREAASRISSQLAAYMRSASPP